MAGPVSAYEMLEHWPGAYKRMSSHRSRSQQQKCHLKPTLQPVCMNANAHKTKEDCCIYIYNYIYVRVFFSYVAGEFVSHRPSQHVFMYIYVCV